jgi:purine-binding chemotaxis protein CheW
VVIVLNVGGRVVGMVVDSVSDVLELQNENVKPAPELSSAIDAAFIMGLGSVGERMLILLDIEHLMHSPDMCLTDGQAAA